MTGDGAGDRPPTGAFLQQRPMMGLGTISGFYPERTMATAFFLFERFAMSFASLAYCSSCLDAMFDCLPDRKL